MTETNQSEPISLPEVKVNHTLPSLSFNFGELSEALDKYLERYQTVITADQVPEVKRIMAELNKTAKAIDDRRKAAVAEVSAPIKAADEQLKELSRRVTGVRSDLKKQVEEYESARLGMARELLESRLLGLFEEWKVDPEFRTATSGDLVLLSSLTDGGRLTAKARSELERRVMVDLETQRMVERRLLELENRSYRAGLSSPLTRDHVYQYLRSDEVEYERNLCRLLEAEVEREKAAQERMRRRLEDEARDKAARESAQAAQAPAAADDARPQQKAAEAPQAPAEVDAGAAPGETTAPPADTTGAGPEWRVVTATFRIPNVGLVAETSDDQLVQALHDKLVDAGFSSITEVAVVATHN